MTQNFISLGENDYPTQNDPRSMREFFAREGYIVVRNAVPKELCAQAIQAFELEVKPDSSLFVRHESGSFEPHIFTDFGFMKYPIMNIQDLQSDRYQKFRETGLSILTHDTVKDVIAIMFGESGRLIHSMYFDGNQKTWPHRDSNYIDSEQIGTGIGVWVAAEDIHSGAGRFYVYPKSHRILMPIEEAGQGIDPNSKDYKDKVREYLATSDLVCNAPALRQGDIMLWSSKTIHGSLDTTTPQYSRRSFTGHYIPESHEFVWFNNFRPRTKTRIVNSVKVTLHGDQTNPGKQLMYRFRLRFPKVAKSLRNIQKRAGSIVRTLKN